MTVKINRLKQKMLIKNGMRKNRIPSQ